MGLNIIEIGHRNSSVHLSLIRLFFRDFINLYYLENKGIRVVLIDVTSATKVTFEDKGFC